MTDISNSTTAVYPGTFDPVTNGHLDLINRGLNIFDNLIVAVAYNPLKKPIFSVEERVDFIKESTKDLEGLTVVSFDGLLIDFMKEKGSNIIIKGLRAISDFEYELQLSLMNRKLDSSIETVFMMPSEEYTFLSSKIIKEVASLAGNVSEMVPDVVAKALCKKFNLK
ncbi:MAG: pantetheine-phosphate adenylyltransferase [Nitrospinota bacterium]|nr:pantetheine-phosphate adenylyltransferase [Nitrospinota bacterium]